MGYLESLSSSIESYVARSHVRSALNQKVSKNVVFQKKNRFVEMQLRQAAQELADKLTEVTKTSLYKGHQSWFMWMVDNVELGEDGRWHAFVVFKAPITRPSLNPSNTGVTNILALLNSGFEIAEGKNPPIGEWHKAHIQGLRSRKGSHFIDNTVNDFSEKYKGKFEVVEMNEWLGTSDE